MNKKNSIYLAIPDVAFIERAALLGKEWAGLSKAAKLFYFHLKAMYNGHNNGMILLPFVRLKNCKGLSSKDTCIRAARELEQKGWVDKKRIRGLHNGANVYTLTFRHESAK